MKTDQWFTQKQTNSTNLSASIHNSFNRLPKPDNSNKFFLPVSTLIYQKLIKLSNKKLPNVAVTLTSTTQLTFFKKNSLCDSLFFLMRTSCSTRAFSFSLLPACSRTRSRSSPDAFSCV